MDTPRVLALDLSAEATGIAYSDGSTDTFLALRPAGKKRTYADDMRRLDHLEERIVRVLDGGADLVVIEDYAAGIRSSAAHRLAEIGGAVRLACWRRRLPVALVNVMHLKIYATGSGRADKSEMRMALYKRAGLDIGDDNQVDAWWLRHMGLHWLGHPQVKLPAGHGAALDKVAWPQLDAAVEVPF